MARPVIFDLDGVLIDSEPLYEQAFRATMTRVGSPALGDWFPNTVGRREIDFIDELATLARVPASELAAALSDAVGPLLDQPGALVRMPGVPDTVRAIAANRAVALASSSERTFVERALCLVDLQDVLTVTATGDEVRAGKPDPEVYELAARRRGVAADACIAIEDTPAGVRAARAAGMTTIAVPHELTAGLDLTAADHVVASLAEAHARILELDARAARAARPTRRRSRCARDSR